MLSQRTIVVGGDEFVLNQYPTTVALKFGISISKIVGSMVAGGFAGDNNLQGEGEFSIDDDMDISGMVTGLLSQIDETRTPELIKSMLKSAIVQYKWDGKLHTVWLDDWYEARFAGALEDMVELLVAIIEDNFLQAIQVAKKKFAGIGSKKSSEQSTPANGSAQNEQESQKSFFE